jgi:UDP-N-acetyl-2-amino-2-deoxyglucuronate dehydrogenase
VHLGIIGGGNISETHARAAAAISDLEIVAVYGSNPQKVAALAQHYGTAAYSDLNRFLDHRPMEIVAIGSPSGLHAEHGVAAAERGLHVLTEKPLDITTERADALIAATDDAGVKLGVFFQDRLAPEIVELNHMVRSGCLGTPIMISGRVKWHRPPEYYGLSRWRGTWTLDGGGALMNQAIHTIDLMQWLFGSVARVQARTATRLHPIEVEDTAAAILDYTSGAIGVIEGATSVFPGYARRLEVTGSEGSIILENDHIVRIDLRSVHSADVSAETFSASAHSPVVADASGHRRVLEDFIRAIETDGVPACDGREGRRSVAIVQAIYASAREGRAIAPE